MKDVSTGAGSACGNDINVFSPATLVFHRLFVENSPTVVAIMRTPAVLPSEVLPAARTL
jgi:hypothetical protein